MFVFCFFVCVGFFPSFSRIFHSHGDGTITGEWLKILTYARHSWPLRSENSLAFDCFVLNAVSGIFWP